MKICSKRLLQFDRFHKGNFPQKDRKGSYSWWNLSASEHFAGIAGTAAFSSSMERSLVWRTCEFQAFDLKFKTGLNNKALCCHTCLTLSSRSGTWVLLLNWNSLGPNRVFLLQFNSNLFQNTFVCRGSASVMSEPILQNQGQETSLRGPSCLFISEGQSAHLPQHWQTGQQGLLGLKIWEGSISKIGRKKPQILK